MLIQVSNERTAEARIPKTHLNKPHETCISAVLNLDEQN